MKVSDALACLQHQLGNQHIEISLRNDCFVDYVSERSTDKRVEVMLPGRAVEGFVEQHKWLTGIPFSGLYQHEIRRIGNDFPYQQLTLAELGIPEQDVLCVMTEETVKYIEID